MLTTGVLAFRSAWFVPFFAIALLPSAAAAVEMLARLSPTIRAERVLRAMLFCVGPGLIAHSFLTTVPLGQVGLGIARHKTPVRMAEFLAAAPPPGPMWNAYELGGYLLFALGPELQVFIDDRNDTVYPPEFFADTVRASEDPELLTQQLTQYDIGVVVTGPLVPGDFRYAAVVRDQAWKLVYWDDVGAVFVRDRPESAEYLRAHAFQSLHPATVLDRLGRLASGEQNPRLEKEIAALRERAPGSLTAWWLEAQLARARGDSATYAEARVQVDTLAFERGMLPPP